MARCTRYNIMWSSLSVTCDRSVVFSGYSSFLHQWNLPPDIADILLKVALSTIYYHQNGNQKDRQHNGHKKKDKHWSTKKVTQKTNYWGKRTSLKPGSDSGVEEEYSSGYTSAKRRVTIKYLRWKSCLLYQTILLAKYIFSHQCVSSIIFNSYSCKCIIYIFILQLKPLLVNLKNTGLMERCIGDW